MARAEWQGLRVGRRWRRAAIGPSRHNPRAADSLPRGAARGAASPASKTVWSRARAGLASAHCGPAGRKRLPAPQVRTGATNGRKP